MALSHPDFSFDDRVRRWRHHQHAEYYDTFTGLLTPGAVRAEVVTSGEQFVP